VEPFGLRESAHRDLPLSPLPSSVIPLVSAHKVLTTAGWR
jgi:hypothetical protein